MNRGSLARPTRLDSLSKSFNEAPIHESGKYYRGDPATVFANLLQ